MINDADAADDDDDDCHDDNMMTTMIIVAIPLALSLIETYSQFAINYVDHDDDWNYDNDH